MAGEAALQMIPSDLKNPVAPKIEESSSGHSCQVIWNPTMEEAQGDFQAELPSNELQAVAMWENLLREPSPSCSLATWHQFLNDAESMFSEKDGELQDEELPDEKLPDEKLPDEKKPGKKLKLTFANRHCPNMEHKRWEWQAARCAFNEVIKPELMYPAKEEPSFYKFCQKGFRWMWRFQRYSGEEGSPCLDEQDFHDEAIDIAKDWLNQNPSVKRKGPKEQ